MYKLLHILFFTTVYVQVFAQGSYIPLNTDAYHIAERFDIKYCRILPVFFTADKGYERGKVAKEAETLLLSNLSFSRVQTAQLQYLVDENSEWLDSLHSVTKKPLKKLYTEPASFYAYSTKKKGVFDIHINPVAAFSIGGESGTGGRLLYWQAAGLEFRGNIKRVLSFYFSGTGNNERAPVYVSQLNNPSTYPYQSGNYAYRYLPGVGFYSTYQAKTLGVNDGVYYLQARGYIKLNILNYINLTVGRDNFFIGDGFRSLILSDYSAPYLFLKLDINFWRFSYQNIFTQLVDQSPGGSYVSVPVKYMAVHHLSLSAAHWLTLGIFETVVFEKSQFDLAYMNPVIFYKAVESSRGNPDKVSIGGDFKINLVSHVQFYGQGLLNEFNVKNFFSHNGWWANKWAMQLGFKYIDIAPNLDGQIEFNIVRPFTYTANTNDNFTNYNQPLAHPLGANFYEFVLSLHYQPLPKLSFNARYMVARVGTDTLVDGVMSNYGTNILLFNGAGRTNYITQAYNNRLGQGAGGFINSFELLSTYQVWHNINIDASVLYRSRSTVKSLNNPLSSQSTFIFNLGLRLNIARRSFAF